MKNSFLKPILFAFSTLTCVPIDPGKGSSEELKRSVAFYPLVGLALGTTLAGVGKIPLTHDLRALLILLAWVAVTGAFHLDGLGDCLDGFFGGHTSKEHRRIMKDAAVGVYGLTGITLVLISKYVLLSQVIIQENKSSWLIAVPIAARWAVSLACFLFKAPKGDKGLGSGIVGLPIKWLFFSTVLAFVGCGYFLKNDVWGVFLITVGISVGVGLFSKARISGLTGDGMGAMVELTETTLLFIAGFQQAL